MLAVPLSLVCQAVNTGPVLSRRRGRGGGERGVTLLEVIIACAVLALALTLLLGTMSGSAREVRASADAGRAALHAQRSEEHTSELQSLMRISYAVFCLKKKKRE